MTMLITGASRGIGASIARQAAERGDDVAILYRSHRDDAMEVVRDAEQLGVRAVAIRADVSVEADVQQAFAEVIEALGPIDSLVNNAGIAPGLGPFVDLRVADIEQTLAVNVTGAFICAREAVRHMALSRGGRGGTIVNVSSKAAVLGGSGEWIHYAASKAAVDTLTIGLSREVAADGIRVVGVRPGLIDVGFGEWAPDTRVESLRQAIPMQRPGTTDEIAFAVMWLSSPAASYVTGTIVDVAGGR